MMGPCQKQNVKTSFLFNPLVNYLNRQINMRNAVGRKEFYVLEFQIYRNV